MCLGASSALLWGNLMLLSLNMGHSPDVILDAGLHVTFRAVYDHQGLVPCLLGSGRAQLPLQGLNGGVFWNPKCPKIRKTSCKFVLLLGRVSQTETGTWSFWVALAAVVGSRLAVESTVYSCASLFCTVYFSSDIFLRCSSRMVSVCVLSSSSRSRSSCRNVQINIWKLHQQRRYHLTSQQHCSSSSCSTFWSLSCFSTCLPRTFLTCWNDSSRVSSVG